MKEENPPDRGELVMGLTPHGKSCGSVFQLPSRKDAAEGKGETRGEHQWLTGTFHLWVLWRWVKHFWMEVEIKKYNKNGKMELTKALQRSRGMEASGPHAEGGKSFLPTRRCRAERFRGLNSEFRLFHLPILWTWANYLAFLSRKSGIIPYFIGHFSI